MSDMKMDTQGMTLPLDPNYKEKTSVEEQRKALPKAIITPRRLFTPEYVKEMKILINEVLDEREGKMNYTSYFDESKYAHRINEPEPPYRN